MPIEFPCTACGKLLRTPDETAGRQAKCPACDAVTSVPERKFVHAQESPFGDTPEPMETPDEMANPYQAPSDTTLGGAPGSPFASTVPATDRVRGPAIGLIVMGSLGLVMYFCFTIFYGFAFTMMLNDPQIQGRAEGVVFVIIITVGWGVLGMIAESLVIVGGLKMKNLQGYGLAMTGAILIVIPVFSPCGVLGIPFGIWALVVLLNDEVKAAFR